MEQLGPSSFGDVADSAFGLAILMVGADTGKGNGLLTEQDGGFEFYFCEAAVVRMIVLNGDAVLFGEALEGLLGIEGGITREVLHKVDIGKIR